MSESEMLFSASRKASYLSLRHFQDLPRCQETAHDAESQDGMSPFLYRDSMVVASLLELHCLLGV